MRMLVPGNYTGHYGAIEFVDGVSVGMVSARQVNHIRACISGVVILEDDGVTPDEALNPMMMLYPLGYYIDAGIEPPSKYLTQYDGTYPMPPETAEQTEATKDEKKTEAPVAAVKSKYTEAQLEEIADKLGIAGLRDIAEPLGIKGRSINDMIQALKAQGLAE